MKTFQVLLACLSLTWTLVKCGHWLCDLADYSCDGPTGLGKVFLNNPGTWTTKAEVHYAPSETICFILCWQRHCGWTLFLEGACLIALGDEVIQKSSGLYVPLDGTGNVAFMRPTYATEQYGNFVKERIVDGATDASYLSSTVVGEDFPWIVIDLEGYFVVKCFRIISDQSALNRDRFISIAVMLGETLVTDGNFASYHLVTKIAGPPPALGVWFVAGSGLTGSAFRYVALQRQATTGFATLEIAEIEIYI